MTGPAQAPPADPEAVRRAVDEVMASSEFRRGETVFDRFFAWIADFLSDLFPDVQFSSDAVGEVVQVVAWIVLALVALLVVRAVVRARRGDRAPGASAAAEDPKIERARRVAGLRERARAADARGEHLLALRLEYTALVVGLGERGDLEYRDAYTNRELLERGKPGRDAEAILRPLVPELDEKSFGGGAATRDDYARLSALCDRLLAGARA